MVAAGTYPETVMDHIDRLRRKEERFPVRSWMAHLSLVPDPQRLYPKSLSIKSLG